MTTEAAVQTKPMQLDPEFRQRWLDALRSDEWAGKETYTRLRDSYGEKMCALGLCAHVAGPQHLRTDGETYNWLQEQGVDVNEAYEVFDKDRTMTFAQFADWLEANSEPKA